MAIGGDGGASATILSSTLVGNTGADFGDNSALPSPGTVRNSIIDECFRVGSPEVPVSLGNNIERDTTCDFEEASDLQDAEALLDVLAYNGGPTRTHALLVGSPAIDAANPAFCPPVDQRSAVRDAACDIGAFEFGVCVDFDGDGFESAACGGTDCDDLDAAVNPAAAEIPGNGVDDNCDGRIDEVPPACTPVATTSAGAAAFPLLVAAVLLLSAGRRRAPRAQQRST